MDEEFNVRIVFQGLRPVSIAKDSGTSVPYQAFPFEQLESFLNRITYLRPARAHPRRRHSHHERSGIGIDGARTANVLHARRNERVAWRVPPPCPEDPIEAESLLKSGVEWQSREGSLAEAVDFWMSHLGLAERVTADVEGEHVRLDARTTGDDRERALTDVGYGLSQVLPVIVGGMILEDRSLMIVEQPEAQLHPRAQARLADFLCSLVLSGHAVLIETHSDHLFHRVRLRAAMHDDLAGRIAPYFVHGPEVLKQLTRVELTEQGELKWPDGFMTTGIEAQLSLIAVRAARLRLGLPV